MRLARCAIPDESNPHELRAFAHPVRSATELPNGPSGTQAVSELLERRLGHASHIRPEPPIRRCGIRGHFIQTGLQSRLGRLAKTPVNLRPGKISGARCERHLEINPGVGVQLRVNSHPPDQTAVDDRAQTAAREQKLAVAVADCSPKPASDLLADPEHSAAFLPGLERNVARFGLQDDALRVDDGEACRRIVQVEPSGGRPELERPRRGVSAWLAYLGLNVAVAELHQRSIDGTVLGLAVEGQIHRGIAEPCRSIGRARAAEGRLPGREIDPLATSRAAIT